MFHGKSHICTQIYTHTDVCRVLLVILSLRKKNMWAWQLLSYHFCEKYEPCTFHFTSTQSQHLEGSDMAGSGPESCAWTFVKQSDFFSLRHPVALKRLMYAFLFTKIMNRLSFFQCLTSLHDEYSNPQACSGMEKIFVVVNNVCSKIVFYPHSF